MSIETEPTATPEGTGTLANRARTYLQVLCREPSGRRVGSASNRAATDFVAAALARLGFSTESPTFECIDWWQEGAHLSVGEDRFDIRVGPYSLGARVRGPLVVASTVEEVEARDLSGFALLLRGEIAKEQLMPKGFTFYNPDEHKRIFRALEQARPAAVISATGRDPAMAGAVYPFPLIEDGDFQIPSVYMTDVEGEGLAVLAGQEVSLEIRAGRSPSSGCNVIARRGSGAGRRVVLLAHIDTKEGTPGALDNAAGVSVLLLLAELLGDYVGALGVELVAMNGEDHYASPGEMQWLRFNDGQLGDILLGVNLDGIGHRGGRPAFSLYGCPPDLEAAIRAVLEERSPLVEGQAWYQSDHSLFLMNGVPALAFTSEQFTELWSEVAHTAQDVPDLIDPTQLVTVAEALRDLVLDLASREPPALPGRRSRAHP